VVAAETVAAAEALLNEVVRRLRKPRRQAPPADHARLGALAKGTGYAPAETAALHGIGTDPVAYGFAAGGSLYPDHVIFLGPGIVALAEGEAAAQALARAKHPRAPPLLVVPGAGVLLHEAATPSMLALAGCLADVTARLSSDIKVVYLTPANEAALLGWEAEKYRQALDKEKS
jgi:rhamnose utilization protein RhaD (predicted bifunctional aldolase and dehydrogenase)